MDLYLKPAFADLIKEDGLCVMSRGLGLEMLLVKFLRLYSISDEKKRLIFCLNVSDMFDSIRDALLVEGLGIDDIPKVITNDIAASERIAMYSKGGCYIITSRILIVDILDGKVDPATICGIFVYHAHNLSELSVESFILRVFRQKNREGFVKAFSDDPESLTNGFGKVERLMKLLYVRNLYLWPRFKWQVVSALDQIQPNVIELAQPATINMQAIQSAILVAMSACINELKKAFPHLDTSLGPSSSASSPHDAISLSLENGLFKSFDISIRTQLDPEWHKISPRTKQLVVDLGQLRKLLDYLLRYDAYSFYSFLLSLRTASSLQTSPSLWLISDAAEQIFKHAKSRIFRVLPRASVASSAPAISSSLSSSSVSTGVVEGGGFGSSLANDFVEFIRGDAEVYDKLDLQQVLLPALECPPKWSLLLSVVEEIKLKSAEMKRSLETELSAGETGRMNRHRAMILTKDEKTAIHIRELFVHGKDFVLDHRHRWLVSQRAAEVRMKAATEWRRRESMSMRRTNLIGGGVKPVLPHATSKATQVPPSSPYSKPLAPSPLDPAVVLSSLGQQPPQVQLPLKAQVGMNTASIPNVRVETKESGGGGGFLVSEISGNGTLLNTDLEKKNVTEKDISDYAGLGLSLNELGCVNNENKLILLHEKHLQKMKPARSLSAGLVTTASAATSSLVTAVDTSVTTVSANSNMSTHTQQRIIRTHRSTVGARVRQQAVAEAVATIDSAKQLIKTLQTHTLESIAPPTTKTAATSKSKSAKSSKASKDVKLTANIAQYMRTVGPVGSRATRNQLKRNAEVAITIDDDDEEDFIEDEKEVDKPKLVQAVATQGRKPARTSASVVVGESAEAVATKKQRHFGKFNERSDEEVVAVDIDGLMSSADDALSTTTKQTLGTTSSVSRLEMDCYYTDCSGYSLIDIDSDAENNLEEEAGNNSCLTLDPTLHFFIMNHADLRARYQFLEEFKPSYVVLYDPDLEAVRRLETYKANYPDLPLTVYTLMYEKSVEEHRYRSVVSREKKAFESLISSKDSMAIVLPDNAEDRHREYLADIELIPDSRSRNKLLNSTKEDRRIVVDVREFRASLPSLLHAAGFSIMPRTLQVGDYALSPDICVERKSVSDLFQSFQSGRLYTQIEAMVKHYKYPALLIEFALEKTFSLQGPSDLSTDGVSAHAIGTKLAALSLSFPSLRFLWARSPHATADIFKIIIHNQPPVDEVKAVSVGVLIELTSSAVTTTAASISTAVASVSSSSTVAAASTYKYNEGSAMNADDNGDVNARDSARALLLTLPGITQHNCGFIMRNVESIAALAGMSEASLVDLIGPINGKKLHMFFTQMVHEV